MKDEKIIEARKLLCKYLGDLAKEKNLTTQKIAEITGFKQQNVSRMLLGHYAPTLDNFIMLCDAIQTYIFIIDKDATTNDLVMMMKERWNRPGDAN
jgi:transcriptional regulator with XRE-family HTH domain